ncbi:Selenocysteine lyase/Cysteine desulfurase [Bryocella elongata]|uniref:Selenocysteine lyase/Cysteine desulfurase n=1 Tax=Bryocella elongata TaxID=863522 RepID=A0A1H5XTX1_9BACT|nr:aminotransferase class V-fold PLP-dependent enzyme [Bryocella elongata]SEG15112.1 Selenocysteine lyase/Cysteine desulfurase [Bryocella elongata]
MKTRRDFLKVAAASLATGSTLAQSVPAALHSADSEAAYFASLYDVDRTYINLENGYWGLMTIPTQQEYLSKIAFVNRYNSVFARGTMPGMPIAPMLEQGRVAVAKLINADPAEIALTRCGTESLQDLITGYTHLSPGDAVIFHDLDYDAMQDAMTFLKERRGVEVVTFVMPEPATTDAILAAYEDVLKRTPHAKLMLVTHLCHRTGLVTPVKEIVGLARRHGVDCIVDIAHSVAQMPIDVREMDLDFVGFSLHKWAAAPQGTGAMFIRKSRLSSIEPCNGNTEDSSMDVRSRVFSGTVSFAAMLTIPKAIEVHEQITVERKRARLQGLRNYWVERVRDLPGIEILTPDDPARYGATTSFRTRGMKSIEQANQMQQTLFTKYRVHTVARKGITRGAAVRVTPGLYSTHQDLDALVTALQHEHAMFA